MDKPKIKVITDEAIADELTKDPADLSQPVTNPWTIWKIGPVELQVFHRFPNTSCEKP